MLPKIGSEIKLNPSFVKYWNKHHKKDAKWLKYLLQ